MDRYINIPVAERSSFIYRVIPVKRLFELFETRTNVLVSPKLWEDPFEHFVLQRHGALHPEWFGQCWTRHRASDAIWRIYSPTSNGIRIRSTPARLLASLKKTRHALFVGKVRYLATKRLIPHAQAALASGTRAGAACTLLVKRPAFRHEKEVRVLICSPNQDGELFQYAMDPHALIDQIMIDPRLDKSAARTLKARIRRQTGFNGQILRSLLYAPPAPLG